MSSACVEAVKRFPVLHLSVVIFYWVLWKPWILLLFCKVELRFSTLGGVRYLQFPWYRMNDSIKPSCVTKYATYVQHNKISKSIRNMGTKQGKLFTHIILTFL